jgi:ribonucleoside-diphosphate reductase alpha chain
MKVFDEKIVKENTLKFFNNDELATTIWLKKYILKNNKEEFVESSPFERFYKIAKEVVRIDSKYSDCSLDIDDLTQSFINNLLMPGGSIITGVDNPFSVVSLGNCFVTSGNKEDSYGSILRNDQEIVQIAKRRGGIGLDVSHLGPHGRPVKNAAGTSSGIVSFCERFSNSTREVGQEGRRGALMLSCHVNHIDIFRFVSMKDDDESVTGANVSVKVTDEFMEAVLHDDIHQLRFPVDAVLTNKYSVPLGKLYTDESGVMRMNIKARDLFNKISEVNWRRAEPGILFWDNIIKESPADAYPEFRSESTNPCGEIPLSSYDSCRLFSIPLTSYVENPFTKEAKFNIDKFIIFVKKSVRIMDAIVDLEIEKINAIIQKVKNDPESDLTKSVELNLWQNILKSTERGRRLGISLIGHGDMLAMLNLKYGSEEAISFVDKIHKLHAKTSYQESIKLAEARGSFPAFDSKVDGSDFTDRINVTGIPRRHIAILTIPPSGTISILLNNQSSGIEPVFALWYERSRKVADDEEFDLVDKLGDKWKKYFVFHNNFIKWARIKGISLDELSENKESCAKISPYNGSTSHEINILDKVKMQGVIQKSIDHSISMTVNLPKSASIEDIQNIYMEAWRSGCKGSTVYREGSRTGVLNTTSNTEITFPQYDAPKRPRELPCDIFHPTIKGQKYIVMVGILEEKPYEVFALKVRGKFNIPDSINTGIIKKQKSKHWVLLSDDNEVLIDNIIEEFEIPEYGTVTLLASLSLRTGAKIDHVVKVLNNNDGIITDYAKVIARQLKKYTTIDEGRVCPSCGQVMVVEGGCAQCKNPECGYGQCG